jgi:CheY-like chemotaxis protein
VRILVVEDSPLVQKMYGLAFSHRQHTLVTCDNGRDALDILSSCGEAFELILLDLRMPIWTAWSSPRGPPSWSPDSRHSHRRAPVASGRGLVSRRSRGAQAAEALNWDLAPVLEGKTA